MMKNLLCVFSLLVFAWGVDAQTVILDHESPETSTTFQYFGSTLENELNNIVANPDASGENTSAMVGEHVKPAGSEVWAGAFANPVTIPVDVTLGNPVCMKVWFANAGSVSLKLEGGTSSNWITTQDVNTAGAWTEVCFDTSDPSIEDPFMPAAGGIYNQVVLFFDFGTSHSEDMTYYYDDLIVGEGMADPVDVTFAVDMNNYSGSFSTVYVSGTFNNWSADSNPLSDDDGDGVYTGTLVDLAPGSHEYKYQVDGWTAQEEFGGTNYACTITDPSGQFVNRNLVVSTDTNLDVVCWNSCYACGEAVTITINLGEGDIEVSEEGLYIAGGGNFGVPGDNLLSDGGNGIHSISFEREVGFESHYTFTNGACGDWACKENIGGQSCADPNNFNDRKMGPVMEDLEINTCFGICTEDTNCEGGGMTVVTFEVDMSGYSGDYTTVYVSGNFNNWDGTANPMNDDDGDGVYTASAEMFAGSIEYKFQLDGWTVSEEFADGDPCTVTDASGTFVNRALEVGSNDITVCFEWNTCTECGMVNINDIEFVNDMFTILPTVATDFARINISNAYLQSKELVIMNSLGQVVLTDIILEGTQIFDLNTSDLQNGLYVVSLASEGEKQIQKIIINK